LGGGREWNLGGFFCRGREERVFKVRDSLERKLLPAWILGKERKDVGGAGDGKGYCCEEKEEEESETTKMR